MFTGSKKEAVNVCLVMDEGKALQTTYYEKAMDKFENMQWLSSIYVYPDNATGYNLKEVLEVHSVHKPENHQTLRRIEMYPTNRIGKPTKY